MALTWRADPSVVRARFSPAIEDFAAGSAYKIRNGEYRYGEVRVFPSYVQAGPSFFIEKSKRAMIAEDISAALRVAGVSAPRGRDQR